MSSRDISKNIYWKNIPKTASVRLTGRGGSYIVSLPDGERAVAFWSGSEAREAQQWLDRAASKR